MNDFSKIAGVYDVVARCVFFGTVMKAQLRHLDKIENGDKILILGGGTGKLLDHICQENLQIDYVESSQKMIDKAKLRMTNRSDIEVVFYTERFEDFIVTKKYKIVICAFFLDLFPEGRLVTIINKIWTVMHTNSKLIITDFQITNGAYWQIALSKLMHLFFRITTGLESRKLLVHDNYLKSVGFSPVEETHYFFKFIFSRIYLGKEI